MKTLETYLEEFEERFELHDISDNCNDDLFGRERKAIERKYMSDIKSFLATMYREVREDMLKDILEKNKDSTVVNILNNL